MNKPNFLITDFEKYVDKSGSWTDAFKKCIEAVKEQGGGKITVPAGTYNTRSINFCSNMTLEIENGATLNFTDDIENYETIKTEFEGIPMDMYMPCLYARDEKNIAVTGQGTINGNGMRWWSEHKAHNLKAERPYLISFVKCEHIRIENVMLINSPVWTVSPAYCDDIVISGIRIKNPADSPNTDGIDPYACKNVRISDCMIDVGDDCIAIKSGTEDTPEKSACENITITNCNMIHGHGGVVIGSEMSGGVKNVTVSNCVFQDTDRGIRLKTRRHRGGVMERMVFQNIVMDRVICPFIFNMYYFCGKNGKEKFVWDKSEYPVDEGTPVVRDILINNILVNDASAMAGFIYGLPESPVTGITISDTIIRMDENGKPDKAAMHSDAEATKQAGFFIKNAKGIILKNVKMERVVGEEIITDKSAEYKII